MTSLIDSYMANVKKFSGKYSGKLFNQSDLRTNVTASNPLGYTVKENCLNPYYALKNDTVNFKYMLNGINGTGKDHTVGKINDISLKLGSLGIATVIAASKGSVLQKSMEFAGLGCWLAAMSLWPKLGIYMPIKLLKGPDLALQYVNSENQKKNFYQDSQYLCWDLIPEHRKIEIADKLGIPKDAKNRLQEAENLAKQTAIQGNTLAMLTAGVATPVFASLAGDQVEKKLVSPLLTKLQEYKAGVLIHKLNNNFDTPPCILDMNNELNKILDSSLTNMQKTAKIKAAIDKAIDFDPVMHAPFSKAVDNIMEHRPVSWNITFTDELNQEIANVVSSLNAKQDAAKQIANEMSEEFPVLKPESLNKYFKKFKMLLKKHEISAGAETDKEDLKKIKELLKRYEIDTEPASETLRNQLLELSKLAQDYNAKVYKNFNRKFLQYIWNNDVSTNAAIWRNMDKKILPLMGFSTRDIHILGGKPSDEVFYKTVDNALQKILNSDDIYKKTITKLSNFALQESQKNEKFIKGTLDYLDSLDKHFGKYVKQPELKGITDDISVRISLMRKNVLDKYISTNQNLFTPIRVLDFLKTNKNANDINYNAFKKMLLSNIQVDSFINKMDHFQNTIKASFDKNADFVISKEDVYWKYVDKLFANISDDTKNIINNDTFVTQIDNSTALLKHLLTWQSDGTNIKFRPKDSKPVIQTLSKMDLLKYIDSMFSFSFENNDEIIRRVIDEVEESPEKKQILQTFLHLTPEDMRKIAINDYTPVWTHMKDFEGKSFLDGVNTNKLNSLLKILDIDTPELADINISKSFPISTSSKQGKTFENFIKESAEQISSYKKWFTRVGIAGVVLIATAGLTILTIGKKHNKKIKKQIEKDA